MIKNLQIAIDGPVAAGKGDIAARIARKYSLVYIYTGAMYRALALACIMSNVDFKDEKKVLEVLSHTRIDFGEVDKNSTRTFKILLNGTDVTEEIFTQDAAMGASDVSTIAEVRRIMVAKQQEIAEGKNVVMEGRDIGLRVLPNAQLKIYLTASVEDRAHRRFLQWQEKGVESTFQETLTDTKRRDDQDMNRENDPLKKLPDAWELDTSGLSQDTVITKIDEKLKEKHLI
jgi:CMP/dCMP kinase